MTNFCPLLHLSWDKPHQSLPDASRPLPGRPLAAHPSVQPSLGPSGPRHPLRPSQLSGEPPALSLSRTSRRVYQALLGREGGRRGSTPSLVTKCRAVEAGRCTRLVLSWLEPLPLPSPQVPEAGGCQGGAGGEGFLDRNVPLLWLGEDPNPASPAGTGRKLLAEEVGPAWGLAPHSHAEGAGAASGGPEPQPGPHPAPH